MMARPQINQTRTFQVLDDDGANSRVVFEVQVNSHNPNGRGMIDARMTTDRWHRDDDEYDRNLTIDEAEKSIKAIEMGVEAARDYYRKRADIRASEDGPDTAPRPDDDETTEPAA